MHAINGVRIGLLHEAVRSMEPLVLGLDPRNGGSLNARAWTAAQSVAADFCNSIGVERKSAACGQTDAIDPSRTWRPHFRALTTKRRQAQMRDPAV